MKTYTLVWGWFVGMYTREVFTDRAACWKRVQEVMAMRSEQAQRDIGQDWVSTLEVYQDRKDGKPGSEIAQFKMYVEGSKLCKWGNWGVYHYLTTGEIFG